MARTSHVAARRVAMRLVSSISLIALVASPAAAGPIDPNHRLEHIGRSAGDIAALLPMPGLGRALILSHYGDIHLTTGDRLVDNVIYHVDVSQTGPGDGLLDGTWHLSAPGQVLYITYIQPSPRKLAVARLEFEQDRVVMFDVLYSVAIPSGATGNYGGGIAMGSDLKLYVGIGDVGNPAGAQSVTTLQGKIFRLNSDLPGGIPADNPISPSSPVYATGVRNPVRMATDSNDGTIYFIDVGPSMEDEINVVERVVNYGWNRYYGDAGTTGFTRPIYSWSVPIFPTGIAVNRGANLGAASAGNLIITSTSGKITMLQPNPGSRATETVLFTPGSGEPASFVDVDVRDDGYLYVSDPGGDVWRIRNNAAETQEPSDKTSITPMLVRKLSPTQLELAVERETALNEFSVYTGDLRQSWQNGRGSWYTHPLIATDYQPVDFNASEAMSRFTLSSAGLPSLAYFLVGGVSTMNETFLGMSSQGMPRPGGGQTFGCPCPAGKVEGPNIGDCAMSFSLPRGVAGQSSPGVYNYVGPLNFIDDFDCQVVLMDLSMEWCGPCRTMASRAQALQDSYAGQPVQLIHVLTEDAGYNPATIAVAERWTRDFGLRFPVYFEDDYAVWNAYDTTGFIPQMWLFSKDGVMVEHWTGTQSDAVLRAAIDRELSR